MYFHHHKIKITMKDNISRINYFLTLVAAISCVGAAGLFEVNIPFFIQLKQCRKELSLLKTLWDYVFVIRSSFDD
jgi:dynein heavy chain